MIKVEGARVELKGSKFHLLSELTTVIRAFLDNDCFSEKELRKAIEIAFMTDEEIEKEEERLKEEVFNQMKDIFKDLHKFSETAKKNSSKTTDKEDLFNQLFGDLDE